MIERSEILASKTVATEGNSRLEEIDVGEKKIEPKEDDSGTLSSPSSVLSRSDSSDYDDGKLFRRHEGDRSASNVNYQESTSDVNRELENLFGNTLIGYNGEGPGSQEADSNDVKEMEEFRQSVVTILSNGFYAFRFSSSEQLYEVLEKGQLFVNGRPLILKRWSTNLVQKPTIFLSSLPIWVKMYNINWANWNKKYWEEALVVIGEYLFMDKSTAKRQQLEFARVCLQIDPFSDLPDNVHVSVGDGDKTIIEFDVSYEWKPQLCRHCLSLCHDSTSCQLASEEVHLQREDSYVSTEEPRSPDTAVDEGDANDTASFELSGNIPGIFGRDGEVGPERLDDEANWLQRIVMYVSQARPSLRNLGPIERSTSL